MKTSIKRIGLLAALAVVLTNPLFSQVPDLTKYAASIDRELNNRRFGALEEAIKAIEAAKDRRPLRSIKSASTK
jgi:hypothetical protein